MDHDDLAGCLRSWRDRLSPAEAGLPEGSQRRAPGLRREEVAQLAGLSVDYLARLEQGRAVNPSPSVLAPLARALRLSDAEAAHLYRVAGHAEPGSGRINRHLTPGVQRVARPPRRPAARQPAVRRAVGAAAGRGVRAADRKTIVHPAAGPITVDCDVLTVQGSNLRLILYTAPPGSADADALALVAAIGLQTF
jgi:transcriptional regulator with XRE-family HTH domain